MDNLKQVYDDETLYEVYDPSGVVRPAWTSARESALTSSEYFLYFRGTVVLRWARAGWQCFGGGGLGPTIVAG